MYLVTQIYEDVLANCSHINAIGFLKKIFFYAYLIALQNTKCKIFTIISDISNFYTDCSMIAKPFNSENIMMRSHTFVAWYSNLVVYIQSQFLSQSLFVEPLANIYIWQSDHSTTHTTLVWYSHRFHEFSCV